MNEIKKVLINSTAGLLVGCSGLVTGQPVLVNAGISLAAMGAMLAKQDEKLSRQIETLQSKIDKIQENSLSVDNKFTQITLNLTNQTKQLDQQAKKLKIQNTRNRLFLNALYDLRKQNRIIKSNFANQQTQLTNINKDVLTQKATPPVKHVYIDGNNLNYAAKDLEIDIDFENFKTVLSQLGNQTYEQVIFNYYTGDCSSRNFKQKQTINQLKQLDYRVNILPVMFKDDQTPKTVGDDVALAISMITEVKKDDHVILVTGDGDFFPVVKEIQKRGAQVTIISNSKMVNNQLKLIANKFISLESLQKQITKSNKLQII